MRLWKAIRAGKLSIVFSLLTGLILLTACGDTTATPGGKVEGSFVGKVAGTDGLIGIVTNGTKVTAYFCDNERKAEWFKGEVGVSDNTVSLKSGLGDTLNATLSSPQVTGTIKQADGQQLNFTATPASGSAGIYRFETVENGKTWVAGVVRDNDGLERGTFIADTTTFRRIISPTTSLAPGSRLSPGNL